MDKKLKDIVLIGPVGVGKTTTAKLISEKLKLPLVSMDDLRLDYYKEIGYDEEHRQTIYKKLGQKAVYQYWTIFDAHSVERILEDHENCVFDFGGGSTACVFDFEFERVRSALHPYTNVVFLIPSTDKQESLKIIYDRLNVKTNGSTLLEHLVYRDSNYKLAKHIVYVKDKTPEEVCNEVLIATKNL